MLDSHLAIEKKNAVKDLLNKHDYKSGKIIYDLALKEYRSNFIVVEVRFLIAVCPTSDTPYQEYPSGTRYSFDFQARIEEHRFESIISDGTDVEYAAEQIRRTVGLKIAAFFTDTTIENLETLEQHYIMRMIQLERDLQNAYTELRELKRSF